VLARERGDGRVRDALLVCERERGAELDEPERGEALERVCEVDALLLPHDAQVVRVEVDGRGAVRLAGVRVQPDAEFAVRERDRRDLRDHAVHVHAEQPRGREARVVLEERDVLVDLEGLEWQERAEVHKRWVQVRDRVVDARRDEVFEELRGELETLDR